MPCAAPSNRSQRPTGSVASSRNTRLGLSQTSLKGRIGSSGITRAAYAIPMFDSSTARR